MFDERFEFDPGWVTFPVGYVVVLEDAESLTRTLMHPDRICPGCGLRIWSRQAARVLGEHLQAEHPVEFAALTLFRDTP